jgi:glutamate-1-semialdehyde aminotransferase
MNIHDFNKLHLSQPNFDRWSKTITNKTTIKLNEILKKQNIDPKSPSMQHFIEILKTKPYKEIKQQLNQANKESFINYLSQYQNIPVYLYQQPYSQQTLSYSINKGTIQQTLYDKQDTLLIPNQISINNTAFSQQILGSYYGRFPQH